MKFTEWLRKTTGFLIAAVGSASWPVIEWGEDQDNMITNEARNALCRSLQVNLDKFHVMKSLDCHSTKLVADAIKEELMFMRKLRVYQEVPVSYLDKYG